MKRTHVFTAFFTMLYGYTILSAELTDNIVFIGNPGVGKSTLVNSLVGKYVAESGISVGSGLTKRAKIYTHDKCSYIDTPGLADNRIKKAAAQEISCIFKKGGQFRIFFVITLRAGRVQQEDMDTISRVMDSITVNNKSFSIIINKVKKNELTKIFGKTNECQALYAQINSNKYKTKSIRYLSFDYEIEDKATEFINIDEDMDRFIHETSPSFTLRSGNTKDIDSRDTEELKRAFKAERQLAQIRVLQQQKKQGQLNIILNKMESIKKSMEEKLGYLKWCISRTEIKIKSKRWSKSSILETQRGYERIYEQCKSENEAKLDYLQREFDIISQKKLSSFSQ